jgi:hypothetical protein
MAMFDAQWDEISKEAEVKRLRRAPVKELFEQALKASGDEREEMKVRLAESLVCDVWDVAKTGVHSCGDPVRRAMAIEITGTRYVEDGDNREYHAETLSICMWPGHQVLSWYGGIPLALQRGADLMPDYKGTRFPQDEAGFKCLADAYEAFIAAKDGES